VIENSKSSVQFKASGPEDFEPAFQELGALLEDTAQVATEKWAYGDILFITDGLWDNKNVGNGPAILLKARNDKKVNITGVSTTDQNVLCGCNKWGGWVDLGWVDLGWVDLVWLHLVLTVGFSFAE